MKKKTRNFTIKEQFKNIQLAAKGFVLLKKSKKLKLFNKQFKERIMLAITEVNGCTMCSFVHTKVALSSGMTREAIHEILEGNTNNIPLDEAVAVLFSQDFAASKEHSDKQSLARLVTEYGLDKAKLIVAACYMITMTNGMGINLDNLYNRLKFNRNKESMLYRELTIPLITMVLFPVLVISYWISCLFGYRPNTLKPLLAN